MEIEGWGFPAHGHGSAGCGPVIAAESVRYLGQGKLPNPARPSWSLLASGQVDAQWVEVDAVVRATDGSHLLLACESGKFTATIAAAPVATVNHLVDAAVRLRGVSMAATDERGQMQGVELVVPSQEFVDILQPPPDIAAMPVRKIASLTRIRGPQELLHRVKIAGTLTCADNNHYFVQDDSGSAMAIAKQNVVLNLPPGGWWAFWQSPLTNGPQLAGEELRVSDSVEVVGFPESDGYSMVLTEAALRKSGPPGKTTPVKASFRNPCRAARWTSGPGHYGGNPSGKRIAWDRCLFLQIQSDQKVFRAVLPTAAQTSLKIAPGSRLRVTGVCEMEPVSHVELGRRPTGILVAPARRRRCLPPRAAAVADRSQIPAHGRGAGGGSIRRLRLDPPVLRRQVELRTAQLKQHLGQDERTATLLAAKTDLLEHQIEEHERAEAAFGGKKRFCSRIEIKERKSIHAELVEKKASARAERSRSASACRRKWKKIHKQLPHHLAYGRRMADVATNVLHNVGNVLNSVNVLAASIASHLHKSKAPGVSRLAGLLAQHKTDMGEFLTADPNGRHVPDHLERLGSHLVDEQSRLQEKVKSLVESIQHIKEIVAMQQNYAKASGVWETVALSEIVEDALRMCSGAMARHEIKVTRDFEPLPPLTLDRHKTLQILFNLLDNAKHACWESNEPDKQVVIRIHRYGNDQARIELTDNGVGIAPDHVKRIFTQGFSTRKNGHGFGLHSSILAAQDMGATLAFRCDQSGHGATFTLDIPLAAPAAAVLGEKVAAV